MSGSSETEPPLTTRSVIASMLLGSSPPRLPVPVLVRVGEMFGCSEGSVRTALSRMAASGELSKDAEGWYELQGDLAQRQFRQGQSRAAITSVWSGQWRLAVVDSGARSAADRAALRVALLQLRFSEQREGVWLRPDNLDARSQPKSWQVADAQCTWFLAIPDLPIEQSDQDFLTGLWDLKGWSTRATMLRRKMHALMASLEQRNTAALAPGFVLSAAVLRQFVADPLLPQELLPRHWPGPALRADYDRYDTTYRAALGEWLTHDVDAPLPSSE
ncbi:MAG: PaaX family transcriptional regulator C-terminal domain-containing protein [Microthrixaceae bacterium]